MIADLIFFAALWTCGFLLGWAAHERDWRKAYITENKRLLELLGELNAECNTLSNQKAKGGER